MSKTLYGKPLISNRNGAAELYSWSPNSNDKIFKKGGIGAIQSGVGCNLTEDNNVTYAYELLFIGDIGKRVPYVICDYVE